ncbi:hypothetical protein UXO19_08285 [Enterobacter hormaechei]
MSTLTKEWLLKTIAELEQERNATPGAVNEDAAKALAAMKLALASLEAEAVAYVDPFAFHNFSVYRAGETDNKRMGREWMWANPDAGLIPVYAAPPAPVSVPDAMDDQGGVCCEVSYADGWNACRAAMLQGADGTLTNEGTIPVTQFNPVADLYGLTSPTGGETSFTFDAVEARDFIDGGWSCQEYVELGRYQEALTDHSEGDLDMVRPVMFICGNLLPGDAEKLKAAIEEFNHSGEPTIMIAGDSPVIPDGWVLVPEEPTHEMLEAGDEQFGTYDVYRRMIAASPQQK